MNTTGYKEIDSYNRMIVSMQEEAGKKKIDLALPAEGHNTWLISKLNATVPSVPYPQRQKVGAELGFKGEMLGHPWIMPFKTVLYVASHLDTLTKEEFIKVLQDDLTSELIKIDVSYLHQLPNDLFEPWFRDIATNGLNSNTAWAKNAQLVMRHCGISAADINSNSLNFNQVWLLANLRGQIFEVKNSSRIKELLRILQSKEYSQVTAFLLEVHKNWRNLKGSPEDSDNSEFTIYNRKLSFIDRTSEFTEDFQLIWASLINAGEIYRTYGLSGLERIDNEITDLLTNVSKSNLPSTLSFNLLLEISDLIGLVLEDSTSPEYIAFMQKIYKKYLEYIVLDANPGVINGILKAAGQADQLEG